jgi:ankyrin repeat protein
MWYIDVVQNAALNGHDEVVRLLIDAGADPKLTTDAGMAPLYAAAQGGYGDSLTDILGSKHMTQAVADYRGNGNGASALYIAAQNAHVKCVRELIQAGVKLDPQMTSCGSTPLHIAMFLANVRRMTRLDST